VKRIPARVRLAWIASVLAIFASGLVGACGYSTGIRVADHVHSLGVTFFDNQTLERDVERPMQDALTASVRALTDVRLTDPGLAEVVMRGVVLEYKHRGGVRSPDNELLETGLYIEVEAGLYDRASNRPLGPQRRARVWIGYTVDQTGGEAIAQDRAIRHIADELVLDLFTPLE
jgi:hypothetical protein